MFYVNNHRDIPNNVAWLLLAINCYELIIYEVRNSNLDENRSKKIYEAKYCFLFEINFLIKLTCIIKDLFSFQDKG